MLIILISLFLFYLFSKSSISRFGTLVNPIYIPFFFEYVVKIFGGYILFKYVLIHVYSDQDFMDEVYLISLLYCIGYFIGSLSSVRILSPFFHNIFKYSFKSSNIHSKRYGQIYSFVVMQMGLISFIILVVSTSLMWIYAPRVAYGEDRAGVGIFWSIYSTSISIFILLYCFTSKVDSLKKILVLSSFALILGYFSGSKQTIFSILISILFYYDCYIKKISKKNILIIGSGLFFMLLTLMIIQGSFASLFESLSYFDYIYNTNKAFYFKDIFELLSGSVWMSGYWNYIPRALFPDKPLEYGVGLLSGYIFPGAAAVGYYPGYLSWIGDFIDFGYVGVFLVGFKTSYLRMIFYILLLKYKDNLFYFIIVCALSFGILNFPAIEIAYILILILTFIMSYTSKTSFRRLFGSK